VPTNNARPQSGVTFGVVQAAEALVVPSARAVTAVPPVVSSTRHNPCLIPGTTQIATEFPESKGKT
jgi:hypothetical protein